MSNFVYQNGKVLDFDGPDPLAGVPDGEFDFEEGYGYLPTENFELGSVDAGFRIRVNERDEEREGLTYDFLVEWQFGSELRHVYVTDWPDLTRFLGEMAPIAQAALLSHAHREHLEGLRLGLPGQSAGRVTGAIKRVSRRQR